MKRILSAILAAVTITVLCQPAFAAKECACGNLPIIVVKGFGEHLFETDPDGEKHEVFPPDTRTILRSVPDIAYGVNYPDLRQKASAVITIFHLTESLMLPPVISPNLPGLSKTRHTLHFLKAIRKCSIGLQEATVSRMSEKASYILSF